MKKLLTTCLLLLCFSASRSQDLEVKPLSEGIEVICPGEQKLYKDQTELNNTWWIENKDENSGEYVCQNGVDSQMKGPSIFVRFRSCENCVELDPATISGMVVAEVVATFVIGVAVYLVASQAQTGATTTNKKRSDRHPLVPNEERANRGDGDYQPLRRKGPKDVYDRLQK